MLITLIKSSNEFLHNEANSTMTMTPVPFTINLPDSLLEETRLKLLAARFPDELSLESGKKWTYGTPTDVVKDLVKYWINSYDWRKQERELNKFPQFTLDCPVEGQETINVHFLHQRSSRPDAIPLLFVHGWPGNFTECYKLIPLLTEPSNPKAQAFHVIAPSLPGFVFSSSPTKPGFGIIQIAATLNKLMTSLGYPKYVAQGGDWGSFVCRTLGAFHVENCTAIHINMFVTPPPSKYNPIEIVKYLAGGYTALEIEDLHGVQKFIDEETGYQSIQGTRPQTLNHALVDSPVGMLSWIREKMHAWTDAYPWTSDEVITWTMLYYAPRKPATYIYKEFLPQRARILRQHVSAPTGVSVFPKEIYKMPRSWASKIMNVVYWNRHSSGGHFAAHEKPELLAGDIQAFTSILKSNPGWKTKAKF